MMGLVLNEIYHNIPNCLSEINASLKSTNSLGVVTYASRAKSALSLLREDELALAFTDIERSARNGDMLLAKKTFSSVFATTLSRISSMKEAV